MAVEAPREVVVLAPALIGTGGVGGLLSEKREAARLGSSKEGMLFGAVVVVVVVVGREEGSGRRRRARGEERSGSSTILTELVVLFRPKVSWLLDEESWMIDLQKYQILSRLVVCMMIHNARTLQVGCLDYLHCNDGSLAAIIVGLISSRSIRTADVHSVQQRAWITSRHHRGVSRLSLPIADVSRYHCYFEKRSLVPVSDFAAQKMAN